MGFTNCRPNSKAAPPGVTWNCCVPRWGALDAPVHSLYLLYLLTAGCCGGGGIGFCVPAPLPFLFAFLAFLAHGPGHHQVPSFPAPGTLPDCASPAASQAQGAAASALFPARPEAAGICSPLLFQDNKATTSMDHPRATYSCVACSVPV